MTANPRTNHWIPLAPDFPELKCENRPELFSPKDKSETMKNRAEIKRICFSCFHRVQCLEYAIVEDLGRDSETWYGGEPPTEIRRLRRLRGLKPKGTQTQEDKQRTAYLMHQSGKTFAEIANECAISTDTAKNRVKRYGEKLAEAMRQSVESDIAKAYAEVVA